MEFTATIEGIRRYTIHGEPYAFVYYSREGDRETILNCQLSEDALPPNLRVGESVTITQLGSVIVSVVRAD